MAFAAVEKKDRFQKCFRHWRRRLRLGSTSDISALEHVAACGKSLYGETEESSVWLDRMRLVLLSEGFAGMERELHKLRKGLKAKSRKAVDSLLRYLESHRERLNYCERLWEGRVIGSGQVEGVCKNMIGRRLKQTGSQWKVRRLNRMTILCAVRYSDHWNEYWKNAK